MKAPVKFGLLYFAIGSGITLIQYLFARESLFNSLGMQFLLGLALAIVFITMSIKADRQDESGYTMGEGIKAGMITFGIGSLLSIVFTYILFNFIDPSLIDDSIEAAKRIAESTANSMAGLMGADEATKAEMLKEMNSQEISNPYTVVSLGLNWLFGLVFPGLIVSLISAAILKKN